MPEMAPKRLLARATGPPLVEIPEMIQATAQIPTMPAVTAMADVATLEISVAEWLSVTVFTLFIDRVSFIGFPPISDPLHLYQRNYIPVIA